MHISDSFYSHADVASSIAQRFVALERSSKTYESPVPGIYVVEARTGAGIFDEMCYCLVAEVPDSIPGKRLFGALPIGLVLLSAPPMFSNITPVRPPAYVRTPHCGIMHSYAGRGIVRSMYSRFLKEGYFFVTGGRQTSSAERMWMHLAGEFELNRVHRKYGTLTSDRTPGQWLYTLHDPLRHTVRSLLQPDFSTTRNPVSL